MGIFSWPRTAGDVAQVKPAFWANDLPIEQMLKYLRITECAVSHPGYLHSRGGTSESAAATHSKETGATREMG